MSRSLVLLLVTNVIWAALLYASVTRPTVELADQKQIDGFPPKVCLKGWELDSYDTLAYTCIRFAK